MAISDGLKLTATGRVSQWSAHHRLVVFGAAIMVLVGAFLASMTYEVQLQDGGGDIGEAKEARKILREKFPRGSSTSEQLLLQHPYVSVMDPAFRVVAEELFADLAALPQIKSVDSVYTSEESGLVSADGHVLRAEVAVDREVDVDGHRADAILAIVADARDRQADAGYAVSIVGNLTTNREVNKIVDEDFTQIMFVSLGLGLAIMLLAFGSVIAAMIPLLIAVGAITIANGMAAVVSQQYALNESYSEMILLLGLAVGIDYSLFIVSRFGKEREAGKNKLAAITAASNTTGRAVFFAGITVLVSLAGLTLTNHPIFVSLALGAMLVVFVTIIAALTVLPALLALIGDWVNRVRIPFRNRLSGNGIWVRITNRVLAKPAIFASTTLVALLALSVPAFSLNMGFPTGSVALHNAVGSKVGLQLLEEHFTGGFTDPTLVVVSATDVASPEITDAVAGFIALLNAEPESYFGPFETTTNPNGDTLLIRVPMSSDIKIAEASVRELRADVIPAAFAGSGASVLVGGFSASNLDFRDLILGKAPLVFAFVLGVAFLLLLVMFRSLVIPIKSILLNMLSVGAAYGVLVMVFQWGWGVELLGSESSGVILSWLPLFLFAILFGLSMDYHMLLLNRVKESYDQTHDNERAVSMGIALTAGQITSAAAIMVGVFGAFALAREVGLQQFGVGLGVSVLIDATVIRSVLLPATMKLLGDWNWYLPSWLEWLPRVSTGDPESTPA